MALLTDTDLAPLNEAFDARPPADILRWAHTVFGERVAALSAMQMAGSVICHQLAQTELPIPIVFVDTGVNFQETLETRDRIAAEYRLKIITLHPRQSMAEQTRDRGVLYLTKEGQKECCELRKIEPLRAIKGQFDAFVSSLRRAEGGKRGNVSVLSLDTQMNALRINPLVRMTDEEMDDYIRTHQVIINPLHGQGFTTIGCNRCTTPVLEDEPPRAGRWRHLGAWSAYCEINPSDRRRERKEESIELPEELISKILGRNADFSI